MTIITRMIDTFMNRMNGEKIKPVFDMKTYFDIFNYERSIRKLK
jgi:hypothetical protein